MLYSSSQINKPIWVPRDYVLTIHQEQIKKYGGSLGEPDYSLLDSALMKPQQNWYYLHSLTIFDLAAFYACGIAWNHPFVDGNKRTAFVTALTFLEFNDYSVEIQNECEINETMLQIVANQISETNVANWLEKNSF